MRRIHSTLTFGLIGCACVAFSAGRVSAEVYRTDLYAPGDLRVVRDTETGLDWLRLQETAGVAMSSILSGQGGWIDSGWRYATRSETCEMLAHVFEVELTPSCAFSGHRVGAFFDLFGLLEVQSYPSGEAHTSYAYFMDDDPGDPLEGQLEAIRAWEFSTLVLEGALTRENQLHPSFPFGGSNTGSLLVRAGPAPLPLAGPVGHIVLVGWVVLSVQQRFRARAADHATNLTDLAERSTSDSLRS